VAGTHPPEASHEGVETSSAADVEDHAAQAPSSSVLLRNEASWIKVSRGSSQGPISTS
jgi:hypothetical protein